MIRRRLRNARHKLKLARGEARQLVDIAADRRGQRFPLLRERFFEHAEQFTPVFAVDADGLRYFVSSADKGEIGRSLFFQGGYEQDLVREVDRILVDAFGSGASVRGRDFVDIGANIGTASLAALHYGGARRAIAAEPSPANFELLRLNVMANGFDDRTVALQAAITSRGGDVMLELAEGNLGDNRVRSSAAGQAGEYAEERRETITVPARPLDDLVAEGIIDIENTAVVWIDTQGHEGHVLEGATRLLEAGVPLLVEYWPYGLRRAGGLDVFHDLVTRHYGQVLDLGRHSGDGPSPDRVDDVRTLAERYPHNNTFTNLLLSRVPG